MKKILFLIMVAFSISSCAYISVPKKNPEAQALTTEIQFGVGLLYNNIIFGDKAYPTYELDYATQAAKLDSLYTLNEGRKNGKAITRQTFLLRKQFNSGWQFHKDRGAITTTEARIFEGKFTSIFHTLIVSENAFKN